MALIIKDHVADTTTTTGTGDITVSGTAPTGYRTLSTVCTSTDTFWYSIRHQSAAEWEVGLGTYGAANVFARTTVLSSSNADAAVSFSAGTKDVMMVLPASILTNFQTSKQTIWVPAAAMVARTTNGAASGTAEMTTNKNMFKTLDFDTTTAEYAQFAIRMPKSWNEGTVTFAPVWSHASTSTNFGVVWSLAGVAISNDDAGDVAFGTVQTSTDTGGTTNDIYEGPESSAITIAGTPAANDYVMFQVARVPSNGSDTMAIDARLHGVVLFYTVDTATDA